MWSQVAQREWLTDIQHNISAASRQQSHSWRSGYETTAGGGCGRGCLDWIKLNSSLYVVNFLANKNGTCQHCLETDHVSNECALASGTADLVSSRVLAKTILESIWAIGSEEIGEGVIRYATLGKTVAVPFPTASSHLCKMLTRAYGDSLHYLSPQKGSSQPSRGAKKKKKKKKEWVIKPLLPVELVVELQWLCCVLITYLSVTAAINHLLIYHCLWSSILSVTIMNTTSLSGTYNECNRVRFGSCVVQGIMLSLPLHSYH